SLLDRALAHADVVRLRSREVMHRGAPALGFNNAQVNLQIILNTNRRLGWSLCEDRVDEWHAEKRLHRFLDVARRRKNVDVVNDFFHAPKAARISNAFGGAREVFANVIRDRNRFAEQIIPSTTPIQFDAAQNIVDRLLLEPVY